MNMLINSLFIILTNSLNPETGVTPTGFNENETIQSYMPVSA